MSDIESRLGRYVERMESVHIGVESNRVTVTCVDHRQAEDMADSIALLLADRTVAWRRVATEVLSPDERHERLMASLKRASGPDRNKEGCE